MLRILAAVLLLAAPALAAADDFRPVRDGQDFLSLVENRVLRIGIYDLSLRVLPDGRIEGSALGRGISGSWSWQDGYFCREMDWSGTAIAYNCQLVEASGAARMRFTADKGAGGSMSFRLR